MYQARDVMTRRVVTMTPEMTVDEAISTLLEHRISGAPVVDDDCLVQGVISEFQLLEVVYDPDVKRNRVGDVMTTDIIAVEEDTLLSEVASLFVFRRIRRLPVLKEGRLMGQISRRDLLRYAQDNPAELKQFVQQMRELPASS